MSEPKSDPGASKKLERSGEGARDKGEPLPLLITFPIYHCIFLLACFFENVCYADFYVHYSVPASKISIVLIWKSLLLCCLLFGNNKFKLKVLKMNHNLDMIFSSATL